MDTKIFQNSDQMLIQLEGKIVLDECDRLKSTIVPRITNSIKKVYLDLSNVNFIDSAGLGVLVGMKVSSNKNRAQMALLSPSKEVVDILTVSKLDSIFDILTGDDGQSIISQLAVDGNLQSNEAPDTGSVSNAPTFQSPPSATSPPSSAAGSDEKAQIDKLCKEAVVYMKQRDYESAAECYRKALQINPDYLPALNNLGIVYEKKPDWHPKAVTQWQRVLEISEANGDQKHIERAKKHLQALGQ